MGGQKTREGEGREVLLVGARRKWGTGLGRVSDVQGGEWVAPKNEDVVKVGRVEQT